MKLIRYGDLGAEKPGLIDGNGDMRDLSGVVEDITPAALSPDSLARLAALDPASLPQVDGSPRFGTPLTGIGKIVCIGLNYKAHAAEVGKDLPTEPMIFIKANSSISGPNDPIVRPRNSQKLDHEVELAVVFGTDARYVDEADALKYVAGYCLMNDVSERRFQNEMGGGMTKGKSGDSFGPIGPWLLTADEVPDPQTLALWTDVNGVRRQDSNTSDMVFGVTRLIAYLTQFMSFRAGDIISTGTPEGVGHGRKPPVYLEPGDIVELGVDGLGSQRHEITQA